MSITTGPRAPIAIRRRKASLENAARRQKTLDSPLLQHARERSLVLTLDMGAENQTIAAFLRASLGGARNGGVHRVGEVRQQKTECPGLCRAQAAGSHIRVIAELARSFDDTLASRLSGARLGMVVEHARDEAGVNARQSGDVADRDPLRLYCV